MYICFWKLCTEKQQEKQNKTKTDFIFPECAAYAGAHWAAESTEAAESCCIKCRRGWVNTAKRKTCRNQTLRLTEMNSQRERLTGSVLKSAHRLQLAFLKRLPWTSGVWCVHLNRIFTGHKPFLFWLETKEKNQDQKSNFVIIRSAELSDQRSCFQDSIFVAQWAEIILHFGAKPC